MAQRLEELLDAEAELFLLQPTGGARVQDPRLHDELEEVLQRLGGGGGRMTSSHQPAGQVKVQPIKPPENIEYIVLLYYVIDLSINFLPALHIYIYLYTWQLAAHPHGLLDVVLTHHLGRAVHVPLQAADQLPGTARRRKLWTRFLIQEPADQGGSCTEEPSD